MSHARNTAFVRYFVAAAAMLAVLAAGPTAHAVERPQCVDVRGQSILCI